MSILANQQIPSQVEAMKLSTSLDLNSGGFGSSIKYALTNITNEIAIPTETIESIVNISQESIINNPTIASARTWAKSERFDTYDDYVNLIHAKCAEFGCDANQLIRVMLCESRGNAYAQAGIYKGLFQQDQNFWPGRAAAYGVGGADIFDPYAQIIVASKMFASGQAAHWGCK